MGGHADLKGRCSWPPSVGPVDVELALRECAAGGIASLSRGRTPEQSVGAFVVLSLASHNVGPSWDELNPNDSKEDHFEGDTHYDSGPVWMKTSQ